MDTTNIDTAFDHFLAALSTKFTNLQQGISETGVFNISISGNAATANRLATGARVNTVLFDGSTNINVSSLYDATGNALLWGNSAANAVNYWAITNAAAGNGITLAAAGTDNAINTTISSKGQGVLTLTGGNNVDLRPLQGQVRMFAPANAGSWAFNFGTLATNRTINFPTSGDVTIPAGTLVTKDANNTFTGVTSFGNPIAVVSAFNIASATPGAQQTGLYLTEFGTSQGAVLNPLNTVALVGQTQTNRGIAISVDTSGYLWGYVNNPISGTATFGSKVKSADTWSTARAVTLTGDVSGTVSADGSADITLPAILSNTGVTPGTYNNITVDGKGRAIGGNNVAYLTTNQTITLSGDVSGVGSQSINLILANTGVTPGTYNNVTVDSKGRVVAATVVNYGSGGGTGGSAITSQDVINALGYTPANAATVGNQSGAFTLGSTVISNGNTITTVTGLTSIQASSFLGNASTASKLLNPALIQMTGDGTWSASFDGSTLATGAFTLASVNAAPVSNALVRLTVDPKGRVISTAATTPSDITGALGYAPARAGVNTDIISITGNAATASTWANARNIILAGHASATLSIDGSHDVSANVTLSATGVTPGTYNNVTVDAYGRVTAATNVTYSGGTSGMTIPGISIVNGQYVFAGQITATSFQVNDGSIPAGSTVATTGLSRDGTTGNYTFNGTIVAPSFIQNDGSISTTGTNVTLSTLTIDSQGRFIFDQPVVCNQFNTPAQSSGTSTLQLAGVTYVSGMYVFNGPLYTTAYDINDGSVAQASSTTASGIGTNANGDYIVAGPVWATEYIVNDGSISTTGGVSNLPGVTTDSQGRYIFNGIVVANSFDLNDGSHVITTAATGSSTMNAQRHVLGVSSLPKKLGAAHPVGRTTTLDHAQMYSFSKALTGPTAQVLDSFDSRSFGVAEYLISAKAPGIFEALKVLVMHDGDTPYFDIMSRISPQQDELLELSVHIDDNAQLQLLGAPLMPGVVIKAKRTTLAA